MAKAEVSDMLARLQQLKDERSSWEYLWRKCRDYILPDAGHFDDDAPRDGRERFGKIIDAEATHDVGVLGAALIGGVSSPARPWLRLTTSDPELNESAAVKEWLDEVTRKMLMVFAQSEAYNALHSSYLELAAFGTACTICQRHPDPTKLINLQSLTVGEYYLADDPYGRIDTLYREVDMTARQMLRRWGSKCPRQVREVYEKSPFKRFKVYHGIEPRLDRDPYKLDSMSMPFRSVYFMQEDGGTILSESGFRTFPAMCPRWNTAAGSVYGRGPGVSAVNVSKRLQALRRRLHTVMDYKSDPPVLIPAQYQGQWDLFRPGGRIPVNASEAAAVKSAWQSDMDPNTIMAAIQECKQDLQRFFFVDVFQMLQSSMDQNRTATEVQALEQEKMMVMGPLLERLHSELLDPLVDTTFQHLVEANQLPQVPDELIGKPLSIEYVSILQAAQRASSVQSITTFCTQVGSLAQLNPAVLDNLDMDKAVQELADVQGISPEMVVPGEQVALIRQQRAQEQQQQQQMERQQASAETVNTLASAARSAKDATSETNDMLGYAAPSSR